MRRLDEDRLLLPGPPRHFRRPPTRSLTEVRPDWWPDAPSVGEHRHFRAPLLTTSSVDEDPRKVETLVEGDNEDEDDDEVRDMVDGDVKCGAGTSGSGSRSGKKTAASQHGASKTSLHEVYWQGGADGSEAKGGESEEKSEDMDVEGQHERSDEAINLQDEDGIQLDFSNNLYERRMQQQVRENKRRRSSCDTEEDSVQTPLQPHHLGISRGGKAAHGGFPRRQLSQTQSEPDMEERRSVASSVGPNPTGGIGGPSLAPGGLGTRVTWAEPKIQVFPAPPRSMLLAMHAEYTSITDELETVCSLLSPPRTPRLLSPPRPHLSRKSDTAVLGSREHIGIPRSVSRTRHISEMSNPEMAIHMEKEHLRDAEEIDYQLMEGVIQRRFARQRNEQNDGIDKDSSPEDDLGSSSDDPTELRFVAPPTRQQRLQQQYRSRSYSVGVGSGSQSGGIAFLTVTNEAPEYRCPPRLRRSSAVEMNENAEAQGKRDSIGTDEGACAMSEHSEAEVQIPRIPPHVSGVGGVMTECPQIFCTDTDADGTERLVPPRPRRPSISAVEDSTKISMVTESLC